MWREILSTVGELAWRRSILHPLFTISPGLSLLALVGVFVEIPFVTNYAFWVLLGGVHK